MLNVRLDEEIEKKLSQYTQEHDLSKSMVVKEALSQYLTKKHMQQRPFELGKDLFGADSSGQSDISSTYKSKLKQKLDEKHAH
ncbi:MAG: ribbon-helix-helix protein, CopG family [Cyclobacteriaceae bacterium]